MEENKKNKKEKMLISILVILILLLIFLLGYRIGKIGYKETIVSQEDNLIYNSIILLENDMQTIKNNQLNIFNNEEFDNKKIIAPHSKGIYHFYIQNKTNNDVIYNIKFSDEMQNFVNMKYKLKVDNIYIKGNAENYITLDQLNLNDIVVLKNSTNIYTLEWYWDDDDELDTYVGSQEEDNYYQINLDIESTEYRKYEN